MTDKQLEMIILGMSIKIPGISLNYLCSDISLVLYDDRLEQIVERMREEELIITIKFKTPHMKNWDTLIFPIDTDIG